MTIHDHGTGVSVTPEPAATPTIPTQRVSTEQITAPVRRPVWKLWLLALFSFTLLPLVILIIRTISNVTWARKNGQSPVRYIAPIATVAAVAVVLVLLPSPFKGSGVSAGSTTRQPTASKPAPQPTLDATIPLGQRLQVAGTLSPKPPIGTKDESVENILGGFNVAWHASCGISTNLKADPRYLWGFVEDTSGPFYQQWGVKQPNACGKFSLAGVTSFGSDPQAAAGSTSRWYEVKTALDSGTNLQGGAQPMLVRLVDGHWMLAGLASTSFNLPATAQTGQTINDDPKQVVADVLAVRQQAFVQHSTDLLAVVYRGNTDGNDAYAADAALIEQGIVPRTDTVSGISPAARPGMVSFDLTEKVKNRSVTTSMMLNWYPAPQEQGLANIWARTS